MSIDTAFAGTVGGWLSQTFQNAFGLDVVLDPDTADHYYDTIDAALQRPEFLQRALFERFNIEVISTTESPADALEHHHAILDSG